MTEKRATRMRRLIRLGAAVFAASTIAACSMSGTLYGSSSSGSTNTVPSGGPPFTVTYRNTTVNTTGTVPVDTTQYPSGATVTVMGNTGNLNWGPSFTFIGWDTLDNGSDGGGGGVGGIFYSINPPATFTITSNVVLYGTWTP